MKKIVHAEARPRYRLWIRFEDGTEGEVDLSSLVGQGVFQAWENPEEFQSVPVNPETHAVTWPNDIDLCPDSLYEDVAGAPIA